MHGLVNGLHCDANEVAVAGMSAHTYTRGGASQGKAVQIAAAGCGMFQVTPTGLLVTALTLYLCTVVAALWELHCW